MIDWYHLYWDTEIFPILCILGIILSISTEFLIWYRLDLGVVDCIALVIVFSLLFIIRSKGQ